MSESETLAPTKLALERLCNGLKVDKGLDFDGACERFDERMSFGMKTRQRVFDELTLDPDEVATELGKLRDFLDNFIERNDELPSMIRSLMGWGFYERPETEKEKKMLDKLDEHLGRPRPETPEYMKIRYELEQLSERYKEAMSKSWSALNHYAPQKWTNPKLIVLMWYLKTNCLYMMLGEENPVHLDPPKTMKNKGGIWEGFVEVLASIHGIEASNIERNWSYMLDLDERRRDLNGEWVLRELTRFPVAGETK